MNTRLQAFQDFLASQSMQIPVWGFIFNLFLAAMLSYILANVYIRYGGSLSNRSQFARNFVLLAMTTTLVITIIKTSLALSLGLVGALSIVRFRAAIKDPEELTYLFLNIAIGLGLGAEQRLITITAFLLIVGAIWFRNKRQFAEEKPNLYLTVTSRKASKITIEQVVDALKEHCRTVHLKRLDEAHDILEASFLVEYQDFDQLKTCKSKLQKLDDSLQLSFIDNQGLV